MDFGDLFWIIPVIYVLKRVFFGPRKPEAAKKPPAREPRQPERQRVLVQNSQEELREALGEIGLALGFPASMMEEDSSQKASAEITDYPSESSILFDAEHGLRRKAGTAPGASLFPMDPAPEEAAEYDPWHERSVPAAIYEADPLFAEEELFEERGNDQARKDTDEEPAAAVEALSPYERQKGSGRALRRLVARDSLQEAVVMKELLDRPVSLRRRSGSPFRT